MTISNPSISGFVAEDRGKFLGSNFLWKQDSIAGVGPITVDSDTQSKGVGRKLMQAVIEDGKNAAGIRLVQDAFNTVSMPLYASLGFEVVEPLVLIQGVPNGENSSQIKVRPIEEKDFAACAELARKIHGFDRKNEVRTNCPGISIVCRRARKPHHGLRDRARDVAIKSRRRRNHRRYDGTAFRRK